MCGAVLASSYHIPVTQVYSTGTATYIILLMWVSVLLYLGNIHSWIGQLEIRRGGRAVRTQFLGCFV